MANEQGQGHPGQFQMPQDSAFQFNDIMQGLTNLSQTLTAQGVPNFNGTRKSLFQWLKSLKNMQ